MLEIRGTLRRVLAQVALTLLVLPFAFPLVAMVQGSLGGDGFGNYAAVLALPELRLFFRSSLVIAAGTVALAYACTMLAAFAFAKLQLRWKEALFYVMLLALTMPSAALTVPLYITVQRIGLLDNYLSVILPLVALAIPFNVLLARAYVAGLPEELFEAAKLDGCGTLRTFWYLVLPLTRPISAVVVVVALPTVIVYLALQRFFERGLTAGALK